MIAQLISNIVLSSSIYLLIAYSFLLIYSTTRFFNIAHAAIITIGPYFVFLFFKQAQFSLFLSILLAIICSILIGLGTDYFVFKRIRKHTNHSFYLLIASLGLYIILQNTISLVWGDVTLSIRVREVRVGYRIFGAYLTTIQILTIIISLLGLFLSILFVQFSKLGKSIRAVSSNPGLAGIFGINSNTIIFWTFLLGSGLASTAGVLIALDTDMVPTFGFNLLVYGIVTMIIGGVGSYWGLAGGALLLATAQHLGAYYIDSKWMDAIAYVILIMFLIYKPLGFSGQKLKKVEI